MRGFICFCYVHHVALMIPETSNNSTVFSLLSIKKAQAHTEESPQHSVSAKHTENYILFRYCKQCRETKEKGEGVRSKEKKGNTWQRWQRCLIVYVTLTAPALACDVTFDWPPCLHTFSIYWCCRIIKILENRNEPWGRTELSNTKRDQPRQPEAKIFSHSPRQCERPANSCPPSQREYLMSKGISKVLRPHACYLLFSQQSLPFSSTCVQVNAIKINSHRIQDYSWQQLCLCLQHFSTLGEKPNTFGI